MAEFSTSIDIEAPPEVVFAHLVTEELMVSWMGQHAKLQAIPGGEFAVDINGSLIRGEYLEVNPPHRVVISWGMAGAEDLPPGCVLYDADLPDGTMRFAEFFTVDAGQIQAIRLLYDAAQHRALGGR
jgi:uncharacterized protein YndB with AHSA1/START domain